MKITKIYLVTNCYGDPNKVYVGKEKSPQIGKRKYSHINTFGNQIKFNYIDEVIGWNKKFNINKGKYNIKLRKPILQYDLQGNFIKEWSYTREAVEELGIKNNGINNCCINISKTAGGFKWKYKNEK